MASAPILDSTVVLATAAAVTDRITIGFGVMLLALRPAAWAAKQIGSLQYVSGNRIVLGVGTGNPAHGDIGWRAAGVSYQDRGRRTDKALRVLPALVTGQPAVLGDGLEVTLAPGSAMPPVLIAGNGDKALRHAAAYGDGWVCIGLPPDDIAVGSGRAGRARCSARPARAGRERCRPGTGRRPAQGGRTAFRVCRCRHRASDPRAVRAGWQYDYELAGKLRAAL